VRSAYSPLSLSISDSILGSVCEFAESLLISDDGASVGITFAGIALTDTLRISWSDWLKRISVLEGILVGSRREFVLNDLRGRVHVSDGTLCKTESVVRTKESSDENLALRLVNLASSVVIVFLPEVIEVSVYVGINLVFSHHVEATNNIGGPVRSGALGELPDASSSAERVFLLNSVAFEDVVHNVVLVGTVALVREVIDMRGIRSGSDGSPFGLLSNSLLDSHGRG
jgi:hypothetical protein